MTRKIEGFIDDVVKLRADRIYRIESLSEIYCQSDDDEEVTEGKQEEKVILEIKMLKNRDGEINSVAIGLGQMAGGVTRPRQEL